MPTLIATSPVNIHNVSKGKDASVPLVSFEKNSNMVVELYDSQVTMKFDVADNLYKATGPQNDSWTATGPSFRVE